MNRYEVKLVIPRRCEAANPESRRALGICIWIPGPAFHAAPE
jgi:hypothetical protein